MQGCYSPPTQRLQPYFLLPPKNDRKHIGQTEIRPIGLHKVQLCIFRRLKSLEQRQIEARLDKPATS